MRQSFLRYLNFVIFLFIGLAGLIIQSTIFSYFPLHYAKPDILLLIVLYLGLKRGPLEGAAYVILISLAAEDHSAVGSSFFLASYLYTFVAAKILSRTIVMPDFVASLGISLGLTLFYKINLLIMLSLVGKASNGLWQFIIYLIPSLLIQGILTWPAFQFFYKIDLLTYKDEHSSDEYDINKGL